MKEVKVDGRNVGPTLGPPGGDFFINEAGSVSVPCPSHDLFVRYGGSGSLKADGENQVSPDLVELSLYGAWYPVFTVGDPVTGSVSIEWPRGWTVATSASRALGTSRYRLYRWERPTPDFALVASPRFVRLPGLAGIEGLIDRRASAAAVTAAGRVVEQSGDAYDRMRTWLKPPRGGPARLAFVSRGGTLSYSRLPLIVIPERKLLDRTAAVDQAFPNLAFHEIGHFWTHASRSVADDWINEGMATFLALRAVREIQGREAFDRLRGRYVTLARSAVGSMAFGGGGGDYYVARYVRPALLFVAIEDIEGGTKMIAFLAELSKAPEGFGSDHVFYVAQRMLSPKSAAMLRRCVDGLGHRDECGVPG